MKRITQGFILFVALLSYQGRAIANEYTDVADAADKDNGDPFDLNLSVGYERFQRKSLIRREDFLNNTNQPHEWDYYAYRDMFKYNHVQHILNINLEVGLFRDLSVRFRLPLILNDTRELKPDKNPTFDGGDLFPYPFKSPDRSGIDHFAIGLWWGILNQDRDDTKPNWTFFIEGRFGVGDMLEASCADAQLVPVVVETNGVKSITPGQTQTCEAAGKAGKGGVSRGVNELAFGTRLSRRFGILDPYFGFEVLVGWAKEGSPYLIEDNSGGQINNMPPVVGSLDFGIEIIPWEVPEKELKFAIIVGAGGKYHSEGREFSPLFDALGTSAYFEVEEYVDFDESGDLTDSHEENAAKEGNWTGMTDVENYASFSGKLVFMIQPAKYVKFHLGFDFGHETEHFITKSDQCKAGSLDTLTDGSRKCTEPNYGHRPQIDTPGSRFRAEKTFIWTFFVDATATF